MILIHHPTAGHSTEECRPSCHRNRGSYDRHRGFDRLLRSIGRKVVMYSNPFDSDSFEECNCMYCSSHYCGSSDPFERIYRRFLMAIPTYNNERDYGGSGPYHVPPLGIFNNDMPSAEESMLPGAINVLNKLNDIASFAVSRWTDYLDQVPMTDGEPLLRIMRYASGKGHMLLLLQDPSITQALNGISKLLHHIAYLTIIDAAHQVHSIGTSRNITDGIVAEK